MANPSGRITGLVEAVLIGDVDRRFRLRQRLLLLPLGLAVLALITLVVLSVMNTGGPLGRFVEQFSPALVGIMGTLIGYYFGRSATAQSMVDEPVTSRQLRMYEEALETQKRALELELTKLVELQRIEAERASLKSAMARSTE